MKKKYIPCKLATKNMDTTQLRENFLIDDLFVPGDLILYYTDCDRAVVGSACPIDKQIELTSPKELRADYFCERRELAILNIGGKGVVNVDDVAYILENLEMLYVGRGTKKISFESLSQEKIAEFYIVSYPSHKEYPTTKSANGDANILSLGNQSQANVRKIHQGICQARIQSSQLVMGFTQLADGSVWNTMPSHTHERRSEVYLYFDIEPNECVFHMMGTPDETRHIIVRNKQVVLSPSWSIHSGVGTRNYTFCWSMGGENQNFDDMNEAPTKDLK